MDGIWVAISSGDNGAATLVASADRTIAMSAAVVEAVHAGHQANEVREALDIDGASATWTSDELDLTVAVEFTEVR
jgi:hypothetical protein